MEIGKAIKHYRNKAKLTQKELAKKINVSERTIGHYETETRVPSLDVLNLIAKALDAKVSAFLEPIPKERKEIIFEKTWILTFNEKKGYQLSEPVLENKSGQFVSTRIQNELVYIPMRYAQQIIDCEDETAEKINTSKKAIENHYVIVVDSWKIDKKRFSIQVDEIMDVAEYAASHDEVNQCHRDKKEMDKLIHDINLTSLHLSVDAPRINSNVLRDLAYHMKELSAILKGNHSKRILETKVSEIYETYELITDEEKIKFKEDHLIQREDCKRWLTKEEFENLFEPTLEDVLELVKQVEAKK